MDTSQSACAEPSDTRDMFHEPRGVSITPNPFSRSVAAIWNSPARSGDAARVYAQDGGLVRQAQIPAGKARWVWDGKDSRGGLVPPGVYVLVAPGGVHAKAVKSR
jgi:flagellar hook assembly protein FlgD